jgi:hypothetical protein
MITQFSLDGLITETINNLSALIVRAAKVESEESVNPGSHGPDEMDHKIKFFRERKERLRKLRQEFEDLMAESSAYPM